MTNFKVLLFVLFLSNSLLAQVRVSKLLLKAGETYTLAETDILVADTLVMMDSSRIILNKLKTDNFIRAKVAIIGRYCVIDGKGIEGKPGRQGRTDYLIMRPVGTVCPAVLAPEGWTGGLG